MAHLNFLLSFLKRIWLFCNESTKESETQFIPLGIIGFIGFGLYYIVWHKIEPTFYENMSLRLIAMGLCLGLVLKNCWPLKMRFLLPVYWYLTLLYIMPFFFTFMFLKNNFSTIWTMNCMTALFYLILVTDWISVLILLALGISLGVYCYILTTKARLHFPSGFTSILLSYLSIIGMGELTTFNKQNINRKLKSMLCLGASIAHELRTPLRTINTGITTIQKCLPILLNQYQEKKLVSAHENHKLFRALPTISKNVALETKAAFALIDMLLVKLNQLSVKSYHNENILMSACLKEAMQRYPFDEDERNLIFCDDRQDFIFIGNKMLIVHVTFNLLKNALYHIKAAGKGEIYIWTELGIKTNKLHFKDTGTGINKSILPHIFDRFFSQTLHGSGMGLAFCREVMENINGNIECLSEEGKFTEFVLSFKRQNAEDAT